MGRPFGDQIATQARKREILSSALMVFSTQGFQSGSIREIAEAASMTEAGVLHHFGSKTALLMEVLKISDPVATEFMNAQSDLGVHALVQYLKLLRENEQNPVEIRFITKLSVEANQPDHPAYNFFVQRYKTILDLVIKTLQDLKAQGYLKTEVHIDSTASLFVAAADGLQVQLEFKQIVDIHEYIRDFLKLILTDDGFLLLQQIESDEFAKDKVADAPR